MKQSLFISIFNLLKAESGERRQCLLTANWFIKPNPDLFTMFPGLNAMQKGVFIQYILLYPKMTKSTNKHLYMDTSGFHLTDKQEGWSKHTQKNVLLSFQVCKRGIGWAESIPWDPLWIWWEHVNVHTTQINQNIQYDYTQQSKDSHCLGLYCFLQVKPGKDLFRQSVLPLLQRADKKHRLSASCSQLRPLNEDRNSKETDNCQNSKRK